VRANPYLGLVTKTLRLLETAGSRALYALVALALALDWHETLAITRDGAEVNPLLGRHGERFAPTPYFAVCVAAFAAAAYYLPRRWAVVVAVAVFALEAHALSVNHACGY
jgi:hypothetical protein